MALLLPHIPGQKPGFAMCREVSQHGGTTFLLPCLLIPVSQFGTSVTVTLDKSRESHPNDVALKKKVNFYQVYLI